MDTGNVQNTAQMVHKEKFTHGGRGIVIGKPVYRILRTGENKVDKR
jgi:hypothetical protein